MRYKPNMIHGSSTIPPMISLPVPEGQPRYNTKFTAHCFDNEHVAFLHTVLNVQKMFYYLQHLEIADITISSQFSKLLTTAWDLPKLVSLDLTSIMLVAEVERLPRGNQPGREPVFGQDPTHLWVLDTTFPRETTPLLVKLRLRWCIGVVVDPGEGLGMASLEVLCLCCHNVDRTSSISTEGGRYVLDNDKLGDPLVTNLAWALLHSETLQKLCVKHNDLCSLGGLQHLTALVYLDIGFNPELNDNTNRRTDNAVADLMLLAEARVQLFGGNQPDFLCWHEHVFLQNAEGFEALIAMPHNQYRESFLTEPLYPNSTKAQVDEHNELAITPWFHPGVERPL